MMPTRALRGRLLSFTGDPAEVGEASHVYLEDGVVLVEDGRIKACGDAATMLSRLPQSTTVDDHTGHLILPGLIDAHIHLPQTQVIASHGAQLLDWLQKYAFVEEEKFADAGHATRVARFFLDELLRNGTTTAAVYGSVHPQSVDALFAESERRGTRMIGGKVMMDRGAPAALLDTAERGYRESKALIERWHGRGRQHYAVSPRFAVTSSDAQLEAAGTLLAEHRDCYLQTHLGENLDEIRTVRRLFPWAQSYTDVYDRFGLLGPRSLFGHCIHLEEAECRRLAATGSVAVLCPTSNTFLGSGLFDLATLRDARRPVRLALATDIGGGTSYSMLRTAAEAYKVVQLRGHSWSALEAFYAITLGNARALGLDAMIGSLESGREADIVVLDARATPAMAHRMESARELAEELFVLLIMGDERAVRATYVMGERVASRPPVSPRENSARASRRSGRARRSGGP
jgi:guanine deaminase